MSDDVQATFALESMSARAAAGPVASAIKRKLADTLKPTQLSIVNDSSKHAGHAGNPSGHPDAETHFTVDIVSDAFEGKLPVARHRLVYAALADEFAAGLHALALKTKTPAEAERHSASRQ